MEVLNSDEKKTLHHEEIDEITTTKTELSDEGDI